MYEDFIPERLAKLPVPRRALSSETKCAITTGVITSCPIREPLEIV